jgi:hypothetical protein
MSHPLYHDVATYIMLQVFLQGLNAKLFLYAFPMENSKFFSCCLEIIIYGGLRCNTKSVCMFSKSDVSTKKASYAPGQNMRY